MLSFDEQLRLEESRANFSPLQIAAIQRLKDDMNSFLLANHIHIIDIAKKLPVDYSSILAVLLITPDYIPMMIFP